MKLANILLMTLLVFTPSHGADFESEPPLMVWLDIEHADSQRAALTRYRNILEKTFERPVVYTHVQQYSTEVRLIDRQLRTPQPEWLDSNYLIDEIPGFSLIKKQQAAVKTNPLIGVIRRPYLFPYPGVRYNIDSMNVAHTMLKNRRLDIILDYTRESGYYIHLDNTLVIEELSPTRQIRVMFRDIENARKFNHAMSTLAGIKKNADVLGEPSTQEFDGTKFQWYMIAKQLDHGTNELDATDIDIKTSLWLESQLNGYVIDTNLITANEIREKLYTDLNLCIVNTEKTEALASRAVYSTPTFMFLDKRMYSYKDSPADVTANQWFRQNGQQRFDLMAFAMANPTSIFAYYEQSAGTDVVTWAYRQLIQTYPHRFIKIKPDAIGRSIVLLNRKRIDYLVAQPFEIQQIKQLIKQVPPLSSYTLKEFDSPVAQHFACSNNEAGRMLISQINLLLSHQISRNELKALVAEDMLPNDKAAFVEAFDEVYLQLLSKTD